MSRAIPSVLDQTIEKCRPIEFIFVYGESKMPVGWMSDETETVLVAFRLAKTVLKKLDLSGKTLGPTSHCSATRPLRSKQNQPRLIA